MPLKSKRKIKQCDPFFKGEVLKDNTSRNKVFKEKKSNAIPKSLRIMMEGKELVKQIENKRKIREQQEKKLQKQISTTNTTTSESTSIAPITNSTTTTTSTTSNNNNKNNRVNKKIQKENIKELDNINIDIKDDLKRLNDLYYQKAKEDIPDGVKEEDDILKTNLKKHKGEDHRDYLERINKEIAIKMKKNTSTYQKRKEYFEEKKLKESLKKKGIRYSDYLEQQRREEEKKKEEEEEAKGGAHKRKKRRTEIEDFDELKDNIRFNEQIERPPLELAKLKDFTSKKQMQSTESSKRTYLWQNDIGSNNKNQQLLSSKQLEEEERKRKQSTNQQKQQDKSKSDNEFDEEKELLKRNLEIFKQKTLDNYKQSKNRKQQLIKINKEKEKVDNNNNNNNNNSINKSNKQFYL